MDSVERYLGWGAVAVGGSAVVTASAASSTEVGGGIALGFAAFVTFFGLLAALVRNRKSGYGGLLTVGLAMVIAPFLGAGYTADPGASWTCWVAGALALVIGGIGVMRAAQPNTLATNESDGRALARSTFSFWMGRAAFLIGLATILLGVVTPSAAVGTAITVGFGGLMVVIAVWSLLAVDPTSDFLALSIAGFALFVSPWMAGFSAEDAAVTAVVAGATATALGVAGYLRGARLDFGAAVRVDAAQRYRAQFAAGHRRDLHAR